MSSDNIGAIVILVFIVIAIWGAHGINHLALVH